MDDSTEAALKVYGFPKGTPKTKKEQILIEFFSSFGLTSEEYSIKYKPQSIIIRFTEYIIAIYDILTIKYYKYDGHNFISFDTIKSSKVSPLYSCAVEGFDRVSYEPDELEACFSNYDIEISRVEDYNNQIVVVFHSNDDLKKAQSQEILFKGSPIFLLPLQQVENGSELSQPVNTPQTVVQNSEIRSNASTPSQESKKKKKKAKKKPNQEITQITQPPKQSPTQNKNKKTKNPNGSQLSTTSSKNSQDQTSNQSSTTSTQSKKNKNQKGKQVNQPAIKSPNQNIPKKDSNSVGSQLSKTTSKSSKIEVVKNSKPVPLDIEREKPSAVSQKIQLFDLD